MILLEGIDWTAIGKTWGPLGIVFTVVMALLPFGVRYVKQLIQGTIDDARQERNAARQARSEETKAFLEALRSRDLAMKESFRDIVDELRDLKHNQK